MMTLSKYKITDNLKQKIKESRGIYIPRLSFMLCISVLVIPLSIHAQLSTTDILASAKNGEALEFQKKKMEFLKSNGATLPWIDEVDVRTETHDLDWKEQEFAVRVTPNTKKERERQKALQQSNIAINAADEQILISEYLQERYTLIVDVYHFQKLKKLKENYSALYEDRLQVLRKSMTLPKFDVNDLINAEDEIQELEREIFELDEGLNLARGFVTEWTGQTSDLQFDENKFIDIERVMNIARGLRLDPSETHVKLMKWQLNLEYTLREIDLEKAQDKKWIDFLQLKYGGRNSTEFRENFSIGFATTIPLKRVEQLKINELELDRIIQENNYVRIKEELTKSMERTRAEMESQYRLFQLIQKQLDNSQAELVLQQYQKIAGASPIAMLRLKESDLKKRVELFKIQQNIYKLYVSLLDVSGRMGHPPLKNYLSKDLESF